MGAGGASSLVLLEPVEVVSPHPPGLVVVAENAVARRNSLLHPLQYPDSYSKRFVGGKKYVLIPSDRGGDLKGQKCQDFFLSLSFRQTAPAGLLGHNQARFLFNCRIRKIAEKLTGTYCCRL
jgi:hypothetical protein